MQEQTDAVVIGGGLIGASTALELARRGRRTVVIERLSQVGMGSTAKSTAIIRQLYGERHSMALAVEGLLLWQEWRKFLDGRAAPPLAEFRQSGVLWVFEEEELDRQPVGVLRDLGAEVEVIEGPDLPRRFRHLRFSEHGGRLKGLLEIRGGFVDDPARAVRNLADAAISHGARILTGEQVVGFEHDDTAVAAGGNRRVARVITSAGRRIEAPIVVNAAGPHSGAVNLLAGAPLPLTTAPNLQQFLEGRESRLPWDREPGAAFPVCADPVAGVYFKPDQERFRIGCVLPCDDVHFQPDADAPLPLPTGDFHAVKLERMARRLPGARIEDARGDSALYDVTVADWCPIVDRTDVDGYFVCIGTSGKWFKAGPVLGWITAELIDWVASGRNPDRPGERLHVRLPRSGNDLHLEDFSRRRTPHRTAGVLA
jgi:sarcosine oxidase subunit beta